MFYLFLGGFFTSCFASNDDQMQSPKEHKGIICFKKSQYEQRFSILGAFNEGYHGLEPEFRQMILDESASKAVAIGEVGPGDWYEGERILKEQKDNSIFNFYIIDTKEECLNFARTRFDENSKNPGNTISLIESDYIKALKQDSLKNQLDYIRLCWVTHFPLNTDNPEEIMTYLRLQPLEKGKIIRDALSHSLKIGGKGLLIDMGHHDRAQQYGFESDSRFQVLKNGMFVDQHDNENNTKRYSGLIFTKVRDDQ